MSKRVEDLTEAEMIEALGRLDAGVLENVRFAQQMLVDEIGEYRLAYFDPSFAHLSVSELLDGRITAATHIAAYDSETTRYALMVNVSGYGVSTLNVDVFALERLDGDQIAGVHVEQLDVNVPTVLRGIGEFVNFVRSEVA